MDKIKSVVVNSFKSVIDSSSEQKIAFGISLCLLTVFLTVVFTVAL